MKKLYYLIVLALILVLVLTGCLLSNIGQAPATEQSGITYLTKGPGSLVGLWHLDGDALDSSGNGNDGTLHNFVFPHGWVPGMFGQALSFDGINDYVDCGSNVGSFDLSDPFTIEAWINPALDNTDDVIYGNAWAEPGYHVRVKSDNKVRFILISNGSNWWCIDSSELDTGWHHIAAVWDGTTYPKIYVDGVDDSHMAMTSGAVTTITTTANTKIGLDTAAAAHYFNGTIDEVRIWDKALTADQISDISPPVVTINAPVDGNCYQAAPIASYTVVDANSWTVEETGYSTDEGVHTYTVTATDVLGYVGSASVTYTVDNTNPVVTINAPVDGGFYPVGAVPALDYTVTDNLDPTPNVGVSGYVTDVSGEHTVTVTATDCAGNEGSDSVTYYVLENFVTGGGMINKSTFGMPGKGAALTFGGTIGVLEGEGIVGQFQIVDHTGTIRKGAVSWHCNNGFSFLNFEGEPAESPEATHDTAIFEGEFVSNRGDTETLKLRIIDNGEPGARVDTFSIWLFDDWLEWTIDGGNFQVHDII